MGRVNKYTMADKSLRWAVASLLALALAVAPTMAGDDRAANQNQLAGSHPKRIVQLGPRPYYLLEAMAPSRLKSELGKCSEGPFEMTDFAIGHRGAPLQFPEHTKESYEAAARMGAGILECDVTFTRDRKLVCRHSQCDLHTTTNILLTPLAAKCSTPFQPAEFDPATGERVQSASAKCCTSDITLEEFKSLCGKMDGANPEALTSEAYVDGTAGWRTDLYATCGTVLSHAESIDLFTRLNVQMTPELKPPSVAMPFEGEYTQKDYAQQMIDEYKAAAVPARRVWAQSFNLADVLYWIENEPRFGRQAVFLDGRYRDPDFDHANPKTWSPSMEALAAARVNVVAPPMWMLLDVNDQGRIVPSIYARKARAAGLDIITWTLERSGSLVDGGGWYYQTVSPVIDNDGDMFEVLDVLAREVGVRGVFSDWPAAVTYYDNCRRRR